MSLRTPATASSRHGRPPRFEHGRIGFAIGDVHGRVDLLNRIVARVWEAAWSSDGSDAVVIFLGDYVDRGPDSFGVIDYLLTQLPLGLECRFLKGNHEAAMLQFIDAPLPNRGWLAHGGLETLASYGVAPLPSIGSGDQAILEAHAQLMSSMPAPHARFLQNLERYVVFGDYAFVHAGVDMDVELDRQTDTDLFWARDRFLRDRRRFSHVVVHGHTPVSEPYLDYRRICIDTGAYATGRITAACFLGEAVSFLVEDASGRRGRLNDAAWG
ncbi:MAG: metallophosphoesterase family protein [Vitreimonas sp.]